MKIETYRPIAPPAKERTRASDQMLLVPILIGVGLLMVVLALMPSMRRFYATGAAGISMEGGELRGIHARS